MIPAEAVEAAAKVLNLYVSDDFDACDKDGQMQRDAARSILEAAAPHIRAQALEDAAEALRLAGRDIDPWGKPTRENYADWVAARAAAERPAA